MRFRISAPWILQVIAGVSILLVLIGTARAQTNSDEVESLNAQVMTSLRKEQFAEAVRLGQQALAISEKQHGSESALTAECLNNLAAGYQGVRDYTNAESLFQRGLVIREKVLGPEHPYTARTLNNLGSLYQRIGQPSKASQYLERGNALNEKILGFNAKDTIISQLNLALNYRLLGRYEKAEPLLVRALVASEVTFGSEHATTAAVLGHLGALYASSGNLARAEGFLQRVYKYKEKTFGSDNLETIAALQDLGTLHLMNGNLAAAESAYQRVLQVRERALGDDHLKTAETQVGMGQLYAMLNDPMRSARLLQQGYQTQAKLLGPTHPETVQTLSKLASAYESLGDPKNAMLIHERVLRAREIQFGDDHPDTINALLNLGAIYARGGLLEQSRALHERALKSQNQLYGPSHLATTYNNLAMICNQTGDSEAAEKYAREAVSISETKVGRDHPDTGVHLENLAYILLERGQRSEAGEIAKRVGSIREETLAQILSFTTERQRLQFQLRSRPYNLFVALGDDQQVTRAILRQKGVVLDSLLEDQSAANSSSKPEVRTLVEQLRPAKTKLMQLVLEPPRDFSPSAISNRLSEYDTLRRTVESLESKMAQAGASIGSPRRALETSIESVQAALASNTALIEFVRYDHYRGKNRWEARYGAAVLSHDRAPKWISLGPAELIEKSIAHYQDLVRSRKSEPTLGSELHALYRLLWFPLETALPASTSSVILSPDARLNYVSFATLLDGKDGFLAEKFLFRYVDSARDLLRSNLATATTNFVIIANPNYTLNGGGGAAATNVVLAPLPETAGTARLLEAKAKQWTWPCEVHVGDQATESRLRALPAPRIMHFATHGFFLPTMLKSPGTKVSVGGPCDLLNPAQPVFLQNPMHRSGIALASAQNTLDAWEQGQVPPVESDGILTAEEAGGLNLRGTWLVTFAACDTGIGGLQFGEGVMGLRRGLVQAGAQNLLATLWPVYDKASGAFMLDFYSSLHESGNPPKALALVQRDWLMKLKAREGVQAAVVFAGPFVMSSQGRSD